MTYEETLEYIHSVSWHGKKRGLSRTRELLKELGDPQKKLKFIHVAGTNGKGSVCACLESILRHAGYKTGLFTSPFIERFNERMRVNGEEISDKKLIELVERIRPAAEAPEDKPTEFELITVLGFMYFAEQECDVVVLEVGLGGEFDSTNVIDTPELAVITAIGLDHTQQLGPTISDVARAKAGIIKLGGKVVIYGGDDTVEKIFEETCVARNAELIKTDFKKLSVNAMKLDSSRFDFGRHNDLTISLAGGYQPKNAAVAITAVEELQKQGWSISGENVREGLASVKWPGRFELLRKDPVFILDGAHNAHGLSAAAEGIKAILGDKRPVVLTGVMADKDVDDMIAEIVKIGDSFVTVAPDYYRALPPEEYAEKLRKHGVNVVACETIAEGVRLAVSLAGRAGAVCALGSLYSVADIKKAVKELN